MKDFKGSIFISLLGLCLAGYWGFTHGGVSAAGSAMLLAFLLAAMEVSLSFDNAVVNAGVLKDMTAFWRKMFLTIGIFVAVFGMRLVFPIAIVSVSSGVGMMDVMQLALDSPDEYARQLAAHHIEVSVYGGIFLLLVFLNYFFDDEKDTHWLHWLEAKLGSFGHVRGISPLIALTTIIVIAKFVDAEHAAAVMMAGAGGIATYLAVDVIGNILDGKEETGVTGAVTRSGIGAFIYLEVLDASFSFDGVIGAFAITKDIVIIMIGLGIGAMFVRSITMYLVDKGTLSQYRYLEHGAHYAIGALAVIMLASLKWHIPEVVTGLVGIALIVISVWSSMKYNKVGMNVAAAYSPQVDAFAAKFCETSYNDQTEIAKAPVLLVTGTTLPNTLSDAVEQRHCWHAGEPSPAHEVCPLYDPEQRQSGCYRYVENSFCMAKPETAKWSMASYDEYINTRKSETIFVVTEYDSNGVANTNEVNANELEELFKKRNAGVDQHLLVRWKNDVTWKEGITHSLSVDMAFYGVNIFELEKLELPFACVFATLKEEPSSPVQTL